MRPGDRTRLTCPRRSCLQPQAGQVERLAQRPDLRPRLLRLREPPVERVRKRQDWPHNSRRSTSRTPAPKGMRAGPEMMSPQKANRAGSWNVGPAHHGVRAGEMQLQLAAMAEGKAHELGPIVLKRKAGGPRRVDRSRIQKLAHRRARGKLPSRNGVLKFIGVLGEQELGVRQRSRG